jgi:thioredoxin 1
MSNLHVISSENFESEVLKSGKPILVEFGAVWCQPCKVLEPILEELAGEWGDTITVAKMDVDEAVQITTDFQILSVPTMMLFKDGQMVERMTGLQPKDKISSKVQAHL